MAAICRALEYLKLLCVACALALPLHAAAGEATLVRVGLVRASMSPVSIAAEMGYFAAEGLDVRLQFLDSDARVQDAVASGSLDVGVTRLSPSYFVTSARRDLKIIASHEGDQAGYPGNTLVIAKAANDAGLKTWKDLPGKRVGLTSKRSGLHYALAQIASKYGFDLQSVKLVWIATPAKEMAALARGELDAALVPAVNALQGRSSKNKTTLRWVGDETPWQESIVFTSAETIRNRHTVIEKWIRAYQRATGEYSEAFLQRDDGGEVIKGVRYDAYLAVLTRRTAVPMQLREYVIPWADRLARLDTVDIEKQLAFWQGQGMVDPSLSMAMVVDLSFVGGLR
jgi:NitT/TauT family transport system substrate-binding protein